MIQDSLMGPKFNKVVATSAPRMQETWAGGGPPLWRSRFQLISLTAAVLPHPASYHLRSLPVQSSRVSVSPKFPSLMFTLPEKLSNLGRNRSQGGRSAAQQKEPVSSFPSSGPRVSLRPSLYLYTNSSDQPLLCAHAGSPTRLAIVTEVVSSTSSPSWDVFPDQSRRTQIIPDYVTNHSAERMCP